MTSMRSMLPQDCKAVALQADKPQRDVLDHQDHPQEPQGMSWCVAADSSRLLARASLHLCI